MQCASNEKRQYRVITHAEREEIMIGRHIGDIYPLHRPPAW